VTALDNGNPRGGWNIIPGGPRTEREGERERGRGGRGEREGNGSEKDGGAEAEMRRGALLRVPLFRRGSYLPCVPALVQSPPDAVRYFRPRETPIPDLDPLRDRAISQLCCDAG